MSEEKKNPSNWNFDTIGDHIRFEGGTQPPRSTFVFAEKPGYIRLVQTRDFKTDQFKTYIPETERHKTFQEHDVMIGRYGPPVFQIYRGKSGAYNVALIKASPRNKKLDQDFMYYTLKQDRLFQLIDTLSRRSSGQTGVDMDALKGFPLPLPPLPEQRKIAEILQTWDEAFEKLRRQVELREKQYRGLRNRLIEWTGEGSTTLKEMIQPVQRPVPRPSSSYTALSIRSHGKGTFARVIEDPDSVAMDTLFEVRAGDIIVNITFAWEGAIALVPPEHNGHLVSHRFPTFVPQTRKVNDRFLRHALRTSRFTHLLGLVSPGGAGRNRVLNKRDFLNLEVPCPPLEHQEAIAATLDAAELQIQQTVELRAALQRQKRGLMQKLLTGEWRVNSEKVLA